MEGECQPDPEMLLGILRKLEALTDERLFTSEQLERIQQIGRPQSPDPEYDLDEPADLVPGLPYSAYAELLDQDRVWGDRYANCIDFCFRPRFLQEFGYVVYTAEVVDGLVSLLTGKKVLEAGSGTGWLASELGKRGIDIVAADHTDYGDSSTDERIYNFRRIYRLDHRGDAVELLPGEFDAVVMVWPNLNSSFAADIAKAMRPGQMLVYEGEGYGGATALDAYFDIIKSDFEELETESDSLNKHHRVFSSLHDHWMVMVKK